MRAVWNVSDLENSLRTVGQMAPIVEYGGIVFDGDKRKRLCLALGITPWIVQCKTRSQLLATLWAVDRDRALAEAGKMPLADYAREFKCSARAVADHLRLTKGLGPVPAVNIRRQSPAAREVMLTIWVSHKFRALLQCAAQANKRNVSDFIRSEMQTAIARDLPKKIRISFDRGRLVGKNYRKPSPPPPRRGDGDRDAASDAVVK